MAAPLPSSSSERISIVSMSTSHNGEPKCEIVQFKLKQSEYCEYLNYYFIEVKLVLYIFVIQSGKWDPIRSPFELHILFSCGKLFRPVEAELPCLPNKSLACVIRLKTWFMWVIMWLPSRDSSCDSSSDSLIDFSFDSSCNLCDSSTRVHQAGSDFALQQLARFKISLWNYNSIINTYQHPRTLQYTYPLPKETTS